MNFIPMQDIRTERLLLRQMRLSDLDCYYQRIGSSEDVTRYMLWQAHKTVEESRLSLEKVIARYRDLRCYTWGIALTREDCLIGRIDLLRFDEATDSCSFAYMLGRDFWNQGYATEALRAVFSFAFDTLGVRQITADHMSENPASGRVMQKVGMHYVTSHPAKYEKCGIRYDADEYTVTSEDWYRLQTQK